MNIWDWVEKLQNDLADAGQAHSAELIDRLTSEIVDMRPDQADALLPEAKALCKTLENPWLEVFVGHWEMRNRIGNKAEGEKALADAVALFEFAHRKETIDCPQSVCVTQDLSACYANIDGPGWVAERIEVCDETLARIDPTWNCFQCLSNEKAEALLDDARPAEALAYLQEQQERIEAAGEEVGDSIFEIRNRALIVLGRHAEALEQIATQEAAAEGVEWRNISQPRTLLKAQALAGLGRDKEVWDTLPALPELTLCDHISWWQAAYPVLLRQGERNTWQLASQLQRALAHYAESGSYRTVIELAEYGIRLAIRRGSAWSARRYLAQARACLPKLRRDLGASALLDQLASEIDALPNQNDLPVAAENLLEHLAAQAGENNDRDPEKEVQWLLLAVRQRPEDAALRDQAASALEACGAHDEAIALLWEYVETHTAQEENLAYTLLGMLMNRGDEAGVLRLASLYENSVPLTSHWSLARLAARRDDWPAAERHCADLLEISPGSHGARRLHAHSLMQQKRFAEAAESYHAMYESTGQDQSVLWDYMIAASAAEDWDKVRTAAATLGMELDSQSGPIKEEWGTVIIRYIEDGDPVDYYAQRTGPVSARIIENSRGNWRQHVDDWVVFDADPVFPVPEDEEERKNFTRTFMHVHTLAQGGFGQAWLADGVYPGDETFEQMREQLRARGWKVWIHSGTDYQVQDSSNALELPGIFFTIAAPESVPPLEIHKALSTSTEAWEHALCWLRLAEHCELDTAPHFAVIERYGL